jgi:dienelactone hydrolase
MITQDVPYSYEGVALKGFLAYDPALPTPRPGVLVVHDAGGLGENIKENEIASNFERWRGLARAGLSTLAAQPQADVTRLAAIGYCFGGTTVYKLARSGAALRAVVGFHSGLTPSSGDAQHQGRGAGAAGRRRSAHPARGAPGLQERDARAQDGLADEPVRERGSQLHQPQRRRHEQASAIAHKANDENLTLKEAALESGYIDEKRFDELVDPSKMVGHGVAGA